jgi:hypothetical protein
MLIGGSNGAHVQTIAGRACLVKILPPTKLSRLYRKQISNMKIPNAAVFVYSEHSHHDLITIIYRIIHGYFNYTTSSQGRYHIPVSPPWLSFPALIIVLISQLRIYRHRFLALSSLPQLNQHHPTRTQHEERSRR